VDLAATELDDVLADVGGDVVEVFDDLRAGTRCRSDLGSSSDARRSGVVGRTDHALLLFA
jgi:hypothetical protein